MRAAVLDVGSNSVLLLVAEWQGSDWRPILETSEVTGLGEGTRASGLLSEEAMSRTLAAIDRGWQRAMELGADPIVAGATMAARIARNAEDFVARAAEQATPLRVLSGDEEARLGLSAVTSDPTFLAAPRISIVDVGGHSTEIATFDRTRGEMFRKSYSFGTLQLRGEMLSAESPSPDDVIRASTWLDAELGVGFLPGGAGCAVALGATGTNLVTIRERMETWDPIRVHGAALDYEEVSRAAGWLMRMSDATRDAVPGMERGRGPTMHLGALILERCLFALRLEGCRVSVRGWRHALLAEIAQMV